MPILLQHTLCCQPALKPKTETPKRPKRQTLSHAPCTSGCFQTAILNGSVVKDVLQLLGQASRTRTEILLKKKGACTYIYIYTHMDT